MSISGTEKLLRDFATSGDLISDEIITVPATSPYTVYPEFTSQKATPSSVEIWTSANKTGTQYTERTSESLVSVSGDFFVNYNRGGLMTFHSTAAGLSFFATYNEIGTFMRVKQMNDMRTAIGSGDIVDRAGNNNLVSHANDFSIHLVSTSDIINISRHSGDPGAHAQYAKLAGRDGGQILKGGTGASENLTLQSTANATRGKILLGSGGSAYDELNVRIGIGTQSPAAPAHVSGDTAAEVRTESSSSWAGFTMKSQGMTDAEIAYVRANANEKSIEIAANGTRAKFFTPDAMLDVSGDARFSGGIKFVGNNPSIIRMSGDLAVIPNRRVGIRTSNPVACFDVSGDSQFINMGFSGQPSVIRSSGDLIFFPTNKFAIGIVNPADKIEFTLSAGESFTVNKSAEATPAFKVSGYLALITGAFGFETIGNNDFTLRRNETEICRVTATSFKPLGAGAINLGDGTDYWNDVSYKTLTDRGCLGSFDLGVELQDGTVVSDVEAIKAIKKHFTLKTVYGVPRLDYKTMPKVVYKPAPTKAPDGSDWLIDTDGRKYYHATCENGKETRKRYYEEGAETTALISILIGCIKELDARLKAAGL